MWNDNWHPKGALLPYFNYRIVVEASSSLNARVYRLLKNGCRIAHLLDMKKW